MFSKSTDDYKPYEAPAREGALTDKRRSTLHDGITIKGDWTSDGVVEFGGTIIGDLTAETLVLARTGKVQGNVRAHTVTLEGELNGTIAAITVVIKSFARITADIAAETITVEPGATIEGHLRIKPKA